MIEPINFGPWSLPEISFEDEVGPVLGTAVTPGITTGNPQLASRAYRNALQSGTGGPPLPLAGFTDHLELSRDTSIKVFSARAQFAINFAVTKAINDSLGVETPPTTLALRDSINFLTHSDRLSSGLKEKYRVKDGTVPNSIPLDDRSDGSPQDFLNFLHVVFSPENVAARIADQAANLFHWVVGSSGEASREETRRVFIDFLLPAIEKGFLSGPFMFGRLPDTVAAHLDLTESLVSAVLADFAETMGKSSLGYVLKEIAALRAEQYLETGFPKPDMGLPIYTEAARLRHIQNTS